MHLAGLERRADHAVQSGSARVLRIAQHHFIERAVDVQLVLHALLGGGGELRHGDEQRARAVGAGESIERGAHHVGGAEGVQVGHVHVQPAQHGHALPDRVGNVAQLEIEENLVAARLDIAHDLRPLGVKQLHADLEIRLFAGELIQKVKNLLAACKVAGDDNVLAHISARLL